METETKDFSQRDANIRGWIAKSRRDTKIFPDAQVL